MEPTSKVEGEASVDHQISFLWLQGKWGWAKKKGNKEDWRCVRAFGNHVGQLGKGGCFTWGGCNRRGEGMTGKAPNKPSGKMWSAKKSEKSLFFGIVGKRGGWWELHVRVNSQGNGLRGVRGDKGTIGEIL